MSNLNGKIRFKNIFVASYIIFLISRILVISGNYNLPLNPVLLEIIYLIIIGFFAYVHSNIKIKIGKKLEESTIIAGALILHLFLFGVVFVNPEIKNYTTSMLMRQGMFLAVVIITSMVIKKYRLLYTFLNVSFYAISFILLIQLISHFSDFDLSNISNVLSSTERSRANFGFGHYNALGSACVCNIILFLFIRKRRHSVAVTSLQFFFVAVSFLMLFSSASRSSLTSLIVFVIVYMYLKLDNIPVNKIAMGFIHALIVLTVFFLATFANNGFSLNQFLLESNRFTLVDVALPTFFKSERVWIGLGYAANDVFGTNLTPYKTYWLDNGYLYTLVTTGYIGSVIFIIAILMITKKLLLLRSNEIGIYMICTFAVYLYIALFEATLFDGGTIPNLIYVILFLVYTSDYYLKERPVVYKHGKSLNGGKYHS